MSGAFVETNALLAALARDVDEVEEIVARMMPTERRRLEDACDLLGRHLANRCVVCDGYAEFRTGKTISTYIGGIGGRRLVHHSDCPLTEEVINRCR